MLAEHETRTLTPNADGTLTLPADVLPVAIAGGTYVVKRRNGETILRLEGDEEDAWVSPNPMTPEQWQAHRENLSERLAKVWPKGLSAVDAVNEQRR